MTEDVPVTPIAGLIVVGPRLDNPQLHDLLTERTALWRQARIPTGSASGEPWSTGSVEAAVRDAVRSVNGADTSIAAVVDPEHRVTTLLALLGDGRTRWTGIRSLTDLELMPAEAPEPGGDALAILAPWAGLLAPEPLAAHDSMPFCAAAVRTSDPALPHSGLGWETRRDLALRHAMLNSLRSMSSNAVPAVGRVVAGASGATEWTWLLDGALTLLTAYSRDPQRHPLPDTDLDVVTRHIPQFSGPLRLAVVVRRSSSAVVAAAWGRQTDEAIDYAVTAARTRDLLLPEAARAAFPSPPETASLIRALSPDDVRRLLHDVHAVVAGRTGRRVLGVRVAADALLGRHDLAWGPVWLG
ncbi:hypothetical protein [Micromonospora sp. NBC_01813]|uniref:hypothetical protein n=1 Tax=Micromonospora sp. NBC_01813 TaxID=2975988 RepID=UPI002DDAA0E5|nr:hypothetical protein [Micromonospora sp. NBC_01813]WSA07817.1 hypothetical protein OG958_26900 [Micromonospora sp. NBC_01813]